MKRQKSPKHLAHVRTLPCLICGDNTSTEAAHIRMADPRVGKRHTGMGEKPDDIWSVPLCGRCHRSQHESGEHQYWECEGIDPIFYAMAIQLGRWPVQ